MHAGWRRHGTGSPSGLGGRGISSAMMSSYCRRRSQRRFLTIMASRLSTASSTHRKANARTARDMATWIVPATVAGLPATVAPIGCTSAGLPVGIQIIAPMWEDDTSIEFAALLTDLLGGFTAPAAFQDRELFLVAFKRGSPPAQSPAAPCSRLTRSPRPSRRQPPLS